MPTAVKAPRRLIFNALRGPSLIAATKRRPKKRGQLMGETVDKDLRSILEGLQVPHENPVVRARRIVEQEVPQARRGPGWDRHWRELEAYLESTGSWPCEGASK